MQNAVEIYGNMCYNTNVKSQKGRLIGQLPSAEKEKCGIEGSSKDKKTE